MKVLCVAVELNSNMNCSFSSPCFLIMVKGIGKFAKKYEKWSVERLDDNIAKYEQAVVGAEKTLRRPEG